MDQFICMPWNSKNTFLLLKNYIENLNPTEIKENDLMFDLSDLTWAIFQGMNQNNLVPHCTSVFRLCLQKYPKIIQFVHTNIEPIMFETNLTVSQINIFKYIIPELIKTEDGVKTLKNIIEKMGTMPSEEISCFVLAKLLDNFQKIDIQLTHSQFDCILKNGLSHENNEIRLATIQYYTNLKLSALTISTIETFLIENSYIKSAPFRNEFMKLYSNFMANIERKFYRIIKDKPNDSENLELKRHIIQHFNWLSDFIEKCLMCNSYQRNKIALQLLDLILRYFHGVNYTDQMKKQGLIRKNVERKNLDTIKDYLISKFAWHFMELKIQNILVTKIFDESEDISESAAKILILYFNNSNDINYKELYIKSIENMKNVSYFYDVESNVRTFEVAVRNDTELIYNISKILDDFINFTEVNFNSLKKDIKTMIENNELYSYLLVILRFKLYLTESQLNKLNDLIRALVSFLLGLFHVNKNDRDNEIPSFAEMAMALNKILRVDDENETLLSDDEQMLLNRIWLNLKVSCEILTAIGSHKNGEIFREQCIDLLATIALGNRHKGVIESVGTSVQELTKYLTSSGNSKIVDQKLESIIGSISNENFRSSCTRRTAGLSIFIYRIILGDQRNDKPSLKFVIDNLIELIEKAPDENSSMKVKNEELIDGPLVIALHCLRPLIHDSGLWIRTQQNLMHIIKICFINMANEKEWSIRNAALQLYGALIPKLIGQNKDVSIETIHSTHTDLLEYLLTVLKSNYGLRLQILQILSQTFVTTHQSEVSKELWNLIKDIRTEILGYLSDQQYYIRNLAAKTYSQFTSMKFLIETLEQLFNNLTTMTSSNSNVDINHLHGVILAISYLLKRLILDGNRIISYEHTTKIKDTIFKYIITLKKIPNFMLLPLVKFYILEDSSVQNFGLHEKKQSELIHLIPNQFEYFIDKKIDQYLIHKTDVESLLNFLLEIIKDENYVRNNTELFQILIEKILECYFTENSYNIKLLIVGLVVKVLILNSKIKIEGYNCEIVSDEFFVNGVSIPSLAFICCFFLSYQGNCEDFFSWILQKLEKEYLSLPLSEDEFIEKRLEAGDCILLTLRFNPSNFLLFNFTLVAYKLLLDEEETVRNKSSSFIFELGKKFHVENPIIKHSYSSLVVLIKILLSKILNPLEECKFLINALFYTSNLEQNVTFSTVNPFAHKTTVNKTEDYYLLLFIFEKLNGLIENLCSSDFMEMKEYFLKKHKKNMLLLEGHTMKIEFIKKMEEIILT